MNQATLVKSVVTILLGSGVKLESENCSFFTNGEFEHGFCTYYGACRIKMNDYMYQGGCENFSDWGRKTVKSRVIKCSVWNEKVSYMKNGKCDSYGNCVSADFTNKNNPECYAYTKFGENVTFTRGVLYKTKTKKVFERRSSNFLDSVFSFLGGLGNALSFISKLKWDEL